MKIRFNIQKKREWGFVWAKHIKVLYLGFYYFGIQFMFGKNPFDALKYREFLDKEFNKNCEVCGKPLRVMNIGQIIRFHSECRKLRKK